MLDHSVENKPGGELVAFARCFLPPEPAAEARCHTWTYFHPAHRTDVVEDAVFGWVVARSQQRLAALPAGVFRAVQFGAVDTHARSIALGLAKKRRGDHNITRLIGQMDTELCGAKLALQHMLDVVARNAPSAESVNDAMMGRKLVATHAINAVDLAMEAAGGAAYYRASGLERCFRDIQGARYHPMQQGQQAEYAGAMALGLPVDKVY